MRERVICVPRAAVIALLAILFGLAFIVTPYWALPGSTPASVFLLALTITVGFLWLAVTGYATRIALDPKKSIHFAIVLAVLLGINYRGLDAAIAWRGDEHFHIENTLELATNISAAGLLATFVVVGLLLFLTWRNPGWAALLGAILIIFLIGFIIIREPLGDIPTTVLLRYPFLNYWFFSLLPKISAVIATPYEETLYRIVPFFAMVGVVYLLQDAFAFQGIHFRFLWIAVFATIPILSYYATILYLEPLAVFLMVLVCLRARSLLEADFEQLRHDPGWYALVAIGFIKETALIFLACFIFVRMITRRLQLKAGSIPGFWKDEIFVVIGVFLPSLIYLFFRFRFLETRSFAPDPANLADGMIYPVIVRSFLEQFGGTLFLFFVGLFLLLRKKEYPTAFFFLLLVIAYPLFHAIDHRDYAGYSRFNLFILPPILAGAAVFLKEILSRKMILGALLGMALLATNLWFSPLLADGSKKSHWGVYFSAINEEYYPYDEAIAWLAREHRNDKILIAGFNYPYPFEFYFAKNYWTPSYRTLMVHDVIDGEKTLSDAVEKAQLRGSSVILFHVLDDKEVLPRQVGEFQQVKAFSNLDHSILVYKQVSP